MRQPSRIALEHPRERARPTGRTFVVTGAGSGLGRAVASILARAGAQVALLVHDPEAVREARVAVAAAPGDERVAAFPLDLGSRASIDAATTQVLERFPRIHGVVHAAGLILPQREVTEEGLERMFAVEVLGPLLLTGRLLPGLEQGAPARVVFLAANPRYPIPGAPRAFELANLQAQERFHPLGHARHLALAKILLARELGQRLRKTGIATVVVTPTPAQTGYLARLPFHLRLLGRTLLVPGFPKPPDVAASEVVHATVGRELHRAAGQYLAGTQETVPPPAARSGRAQRELWSALEGLLGEDLLGGPGYDAGPRSGGR